MAEMDTSQIARTPRTWFQECPSRNRTAPLPSVSAGMRAHGPLITNSGTVAPYRLTRNVFPMVPISFGARLDCLPDVYGVQVERA